MPLLRYFAATCITSQRWIAPAVVFVASAVATFAAGGSPLTNFGVGAVLLFPISAWITVATVNAVEASQLAVVATAAGSARRARHSAVALAGMVSLLLAALSLLVAALRAPSGLSLSIVGAAVAAHLTTVLGGVALGAIVAAPRTVRGGSALLAIVLVTLADLLIPYTVPERMVLKALSGDSPRWSMLAAAALSTGLLAAALLAGSSRLARMNS